MQLKTTAYNPRNYYQNNAELKEAIDRIASGYFSPSNTDLFQPIVESLLIKDEYLILADYQAYIDCQERVSQAYRDTQNWLRMSILNVARMGKFSSDRTIQEYCQEIWQVEPVPIEIEEYRSSHAGLKVKRKI